MDGNSHGMTDAFMTRQKLGFVVELDVPVDVIAPALRRVAQAECDTDRWRLVRPFRRTNEMHACLLGRATAFPPIARDAATHDVLPVFPAALCHRNHVIERQLARREPVTTVLTDVVVARVDVRAREWNVLHRLADA